MSDVTVRAVQPGDEKYPLINNIADVDPNTRVDFVTYCGPTIQNEFGVPCVRAYVDGYNVPQFGPPPADLLHASKVWERTKQGLSIIFEGSGLALVFIAAVKIKQYFGYP